MKKLTPNTHEQLGRQLFAIRNELLTISTRLPYPKAHKVHRQATMAINAVDGLRCTLDGLLSLEVGFERFNPQTYYPGDGNTNG